MDWNNFNSILVRVDGADMAKMNRIRAWARRNNATVKVSRYARDAYEGHVKVPMPLGRDQQAAKVTELKAII